MRVNVRPPKGKMSRCRPKNRQLNGIKDDLQKTGNIDQGNKHIKNSDRRKEVVLTANVVEELLSYREEKQ